MRPIGRAQSGYYPTPPHVVTALCRHLTNQPGQPGRMLDPCAGEGIAGALVVKTMPEVDSYGIELDKQRALQAATRLTHVLRADAHVVAVQRDSMNLLFLNPPYDIDRNGQRTEYTWLKRWTPVLQPKGILLYVIPEGRYSEQVLEYLSAHFRDPTLFRFPDPDHARFRQTVFIGTRVSTPNHSHTVRNTLWRLLRNHALPVLSINDADCQYRLPPLAIRNPIAFESRWIDPIDLYRMAHEQGVWSDRSTKDLLTFDHTRIANPLLPLRIGHLTRLIIAGMFNNQTIQQEGTRWIIKGRGRKDTQELSPITDTVTTADGPEERTQYRTIERYIPEIRAWNITEGPDFGTYITINH